MIEHFRNDISTVFSIAPFEVSEHKPGLYPGSYKIKACMDDRKPESIKVGAAEHLMTVGGRKEPIRIITASFEIAASIVNDTLTAQLWVSPEECPGMTWIQGNISIESFIVQHKEEYSKMKERQKRWFLRLCKETDNDWNRYHNHHAVSMPAKFAAKALGINPAWLNDETTALQYQRCPACSVMNDPQNAICSNCRCILNEAKFKTLNFAQKAG